MRATKIVKRELVLCGGTVNYLYAKSLQSELPRDTQRRVAIEACHCSKNAPVALANEAARRQREARKDRNPYDKVWLFFDFPPSLTATLSSLQEGRKMELAYSPTSLEHWFILHFEECPNVFNSQEDATQHLKTLWPGYRRGKVDAYMELKDLLPTAIAHAETVNASLKVTNTAGLYAPYFTVQNLIYYFETLKLAS